MLVTGATGYLGSQLLLRLLVARFQPIVIKRTTSDISRIKHVMRDLPIYDTDTCSIEQIFKKEGPIPLILHTATSYGRYGESWSEVMEANVSYPLRLFEVALRNGTEWIINSDTSLSKQVSPYALSKHQLREWGKAASRQMKLVQWINVKLQSIYGPGDGKSIVTQLLESCTSQQEEYPLTEGLQKRDFVYIDDVVDAYATLLRFGLTSKQRYQEFQVGSGKTVSIKELALLIKEKTASNNSFKFGAVPYRQHEPMELKADLTNIRLLGWEPRTNLTQGIQQLLAEQSK